ncbi:MAG TPA: helix-turn-helix transcriptional regulator [Cytophagaceae bacterium]|jgi:AraC-like DNA-binding protein
MKNFLKIKSISQLHEMLGFSKPKHPLVTIIDYSTVTPSKDHYDVNIITDFYIISLKTPAPKSIQYGRQYYDFEEGTLMFLSPNQVFSVKDFNEGLSFNGWGLYFHPDLIANSSLSNNMKNLTFFSYSVSEALHVSDEEKKILQSIIDNILNEYNRAIDEYSRVVIVSAIELLLNYCQRFYGRQFITRKKLNTDTISKFENILKEYFSKSQEITGLPNVQYFSSQLNLSSNYLSDLLKKETGKATKEHINDYVMTLAKEKLLSTNESVSEIAYSLGFDYPQYFNRVFKSKTGMTPLEYRQVS